MGWLQASSIFFTALIMTVGLAGLVIPIFPGGVVIWLGALFYGVTNGFSTAGIIIFILITILMIAGSLADNILMGTRARKEGAAWISIFLGIVGGIVGTIFIFPPFGGLIGAPLALFGAEYLRDRDRRRALRVTRALLIGWGWSFVARFGLGVVKIILWAIWAWSNSGA
jgi:uncharacterized protein YqgC (DUF456 family)